jgi:hypothetical protein
MNAPRLPSPAAIPTVHPLVLERRIADMLRLGLSAMIPAALALAITIALPSARLPEILAAIAGMIGITALMVSSRLDVTVTAIAVYLGIVDGPVKMLVGAREITASVQTIVILAVCAGAVARVVVRRERVTLPALSGWVLAWVVLVLVNAFNPKTENVLHILGGFRQQLQYVPFFFFGYLLIRSKRRFRQLFIVIGVIAVANGVVAAYQTELSPDQLAGWGPGYRALIHPQGRGTGRVYVSEGEARLRPPGLGSEAGFSGAVGHIALPMCLALLAISRRRRWVAAILCLGTIVAVMVGLARLPLIGSVLGVFVFAGLAALAGRRFTRAMGALLAIVVLMIPVGAVVVSTLRSGTFKRYEKIGANSETTNHKEGSWSKIPEFVAASPFGFGLGNSGPIAGLGGRSNNLLEGHGLTSETEYNVLVKELGLPGLILWPATIIYITLLAAAGMRYIKDGDIAICLAGTLAAFVPLPLEGFSGFLGASTASGPYFWFAIGVAAYWLAGAGRGIARNRSGGADGSLVAA